MPANKTTRTRKYVQLKNVKGEAHSLKNNYEADSLNAF